MWNDITVNYQGQQGNNQLRLTRLLTNFKWNENKQADENFKIFDHLITQLTLQGAQPVNTQQFLILSDSLPPSWHTLRRPHSHQRRQQHRSPTPSYTTTLLNMEERHRQRSCQLHPRRKQKNKHGQQTTTNPRKTPTPQLLLLHQTKPRRRGLSLPQKGQERRPLLPQKGVPIPIQRTEKHRRIRTKTHR